MHVKPDIQKLPYLEKNKNRISQIRSLHSYEQTFFYDHEQAHIKWRVGITLLFNRSAISENDTIVNGYALPNRRSHALMVSMISS